VSTPLGIAIVLKVPSGTADGTTGTLTVERDGAVLAALPYRVDSRVNRLRADLTVPGKQAATIQAGIDQVTDRNRDGNLVVEVGPGLYHENVTVNRSVTLRGRYGSGITVIQGTPSGAAMSVTAAQASITGLTTTGAATGFALSGGGAVLMDVRASNNVGAGITVSGGADQVWRAEVSGNGTDGISITGANGAVCADSLLFNNGGIGLNLSTAQNALLDSNRVAFNAGGGLALNGVTGTTVTDNQSVANFGGASSGQGGGAGGGQGGETAAGAGLALAGSQNNQILGNLISRNDDDGVHMDQTSANTLSGNTLDDNHGYGLFVRRSTGDDFGAAAGVQPPPGDNQVSGNRKGDVITK
jgi:parallel beta-helix repeat protein